MIYLLLFYGPSLRSIQDHALVELLSSVNASFRRPISSVLRLLALPLSGLVGKVDSNIMVSWYVYHGWNLPKSGFVYFIKVHLQLLGLSSKTWELRSVIDGFPFDFWCVTFSGRGSEVADQLFDRFCVRWLRLPCPMSLVISALVSRFLIT